MHSRVEREEGVAATVPIGKSNERGSRVSGKQRRTDSIDDDERDETGTRGWTSRYRSRIRRTRSKEERSGDDRQNCARARVGWTHVHEWKGREVHAGAFIASARTCAMSSSAG